MAASGPVMVPMAEVEALVASMVAMHGSMAAGDAAACAVVPPVGTGSVVRAIRRGRLRGCISAKVVRRMMAALDGAPAMVETRCRECGAVLRSGSVDAGHTRCEVHRPIAAWRSRFLVAA
jgi:hypothetical protein